MTESRPLSTTPHYASVPRVGDGLERVRKMSLEELFETVAQSLEEYRYIEAAIKAHHRKMVGQLNQKLADEQMERMRRGRRE